MPVNCPEPAKGDSVLLWMVEQTECGVIPENPVLKPLRFTGGVPQFAPEFMQSAELNGTREILYQRLISEQVNGDNSFELAAGAQDDRIEAALYGTWAGATSESSVDVAVDATAKTFTRAAGDFTVNVSVGDLVKFPELTGENAEPVIATAVTPTVITAANATGLTDELSTSTNVITGDQLTPSNVKRLFTVFMQVLDAETGAVGTGQLFTFVDVRFTASSFNFAVNSGVTGSVSMIGGQYIPDSTFPSGTTFDDVVDSEFYSCVDGCITSNGAIKRFVTSLDLTFDNSANAEFEINKSARVSNVSIGKSVNTFSGSAGYYSSDNILSMVNETDVNLSVVASHKGNAFAVEFPTARINESTIPVDGEGTIISTFTGQGFGQPSVILRRI